MLTVKTEKENYLVRIRHKVGLCREEGQCAGLANASVNRSSSHVQAKLRNHSATEGTAVKNLKTKILLIVIGVGLAISAYSQAFLNRGSEMRP
jgi:hypothetical protein